MAKLIDSLTWIQDGEKANATIFNRSLKELVNLMDAKDFSSLSSTSGFKIDIAEKDVSVLVGDLVYRGDDSMYYQALGGDEVTENIVGTYFEIDSIPVIVWSGILIKTGLVVGDSYYLSDTVPGGITNTPFDGAIKVGVAISETELLANAVGTGSGGGGSVTTEISAGSTINAADGDLVYRALNGDINSAIADGTDAENVIGRYVIVNGRDTLVYSGELDDFTGLTVGSTYFLSNITPGEITDTDYTNSIKIGTALSDSGLLLDIDNTGNSGGGSVISLDGVSILDGAQDGDFIYRTIDGDIGLALVNGTDKENVIGVLQVDAAGRNSIVYGGLIDGYAGLVVGSYYYLSPTVLGGIQVDSYPGAIKVGIADSATELLVDIDKAPSSSGDEELEYQFLLNNSSFKQAYFNVFSELNTMTQNDGGTASNVVYSALNTSYIVQDTFDIETPDNLLGDGNITSFTSFQVSANIVGDITTQFSVNDGVNYTDVPDTGYIKIKNGVTNFKLRFIANEADAEIKSFGVLFEEEGFIGTNRIKLREYITCTEDIAEGTEVFLPNGQYYTMNGISLNIRVEGLALVPGIDYTEETDKSVKFTQEILLGDVIEFEEVYGYVDLSEDNILRVDQNIIDINKLKIDVISYAIALG